MGRRYYANSAPQQTLQAAITNSETVITVSNFAGWPSTPFYGTIGVGTTSEEIVLVTSISGTTATVSRGQDGTSAVSHSAGETFNQTVIRLDLDEANAHVNATSDVHGISGALASASTVNTLQTQTETLQTQMGSLGAAATRNVGTTAGTVAAGDDSRFIGLSVNAQASAYSLVAADAGFIVEISASSAAGVTVPASVFQAGQMVEVAQYGTGQVTLVAGSGMTLRTAGSLKTRAQYSSVFIRFRSATEAVISGDMA